MTRPIPPRPTPTHCALGLAAFRRHAAVMPAAAPRPLPENLGLFFVGERPRPAALVSPALARRLRAAGNPSGRDNAEVVRPVATGATGRRQPWVIDFAPHTSEREAALHVLPFHHLYRAIARKRGAWWLNPRAQPLLRAALARRERYLATPVRGPGPRFRWIEPDHLPDATLLVVPRDDDFIHGILASPAFAAWWRAHHAARAPTAAGEGFPFPWEPRSLLGSLSSAQQECRRAVGAAARAGDAAALASAVAAAYGWPASLTPEAWLERLRALHHERSG